MPPNMPTNIVFSVPARKSFVSSVICWLTGSSASHCAIVYYDAEFACPMVLEADWYGFGLLTLNRWAQRNRIVEAFPVEISEGLALVAREYLGAPYDYGGALGVLAVRLGRFLKRVVKNPLHSPRAVFCSEVATVALQKSGFPGADLLSPADTTPGDLLEFLKAWRTRS